MNHSDIEEMVSAYANGELLRTQREFVEEHLSGCADCRDALAENTWVRNRLTSLRAIPVTSDIKEATMERIAAIPTASRPDRRYIRPALVASTAVAVVAVVLLVFQLWPATSNGIISKVYAAMAQLQYYSGDRSMTVTHNGELSQFFMEFEFVAPDRYQGRLTSSEDGEIGEFIIIGEEQYVGIVCCGPEYQILARLIGPGGISAVPSREGTLETLDFLTDLEQLPDAQIDGVDYLHFRGNAPNLIPPDATSGTGHIELWVGKEDYTIRQEKWDWQYVQPDPESQQVHEIAITHVIRYSGFNEPNEIEPPLTASGDVKPGWSLVRTSPVRN